jgi:hypothetical protein
VRTRLYSGAEQFVDELHRRWTVRRRPAATAPIGGPARFVPLEREMPEHAVFISYAREDLAAVQRLKSRLDAVGIKSWLDMEQLDAGVDFDRRVQRNIARCAFFVPVISAVTEKRAEAYFRREWNYALDRSLNMADDAIFILPVAIDAIDARTARIPERFRSLQITAAPGGEAPDEFLQHLKALAAER